MISEDYIEYPRPSAGEIKGDFVRDRSGDPPVADRDPTPIKEKVKVSKGNGQFTPGSLPYNRTETLSKCYVDPRGMYRTHFGDGYCVRSEAKKFIFYHVRKSGSSTGREVAAKHFQGIDNQRCPKPKDKDKYKVAFVRNPITRFFAQYEETFVRTLRKHGKPTVKVPSKFDVYHRDLKDYKDYEYIFCGEDSRSPRERGKPKPCDQKPTVDHGELARRFERFLDVWDGTVFEAHLAMQAPILSRRDDGLPIEVNFVGDTKHTKEHWEEIGRRRGVPDVKVIRGRAYPRRMNISYVSEKAYKKICRLAAIDFCCLNFELPPQCVDAGVACKWEEMGSGEKRIVPVLSGGRL